jgi:hypothetical protein
MGFLGRVCHFVFDELESIDARIMLEFLNTFVIKGTYIYFGY